MPLVGLGTWRSPEGQVYQAVLDAIESGYRHFDCAYAYRNEGEVGRALSYAISAGMVKRDELFVTSKLWLTFLAEDRVEQCLKRSLKHLQLSYVDLYLVHWPMAFKDDDDEMYPLSSDGSVSFRTDITFTDTWRGMENILKLGLAKSIGVSNFNEDQINRLLEKATIKPAVNQIEHHPYLSQKQLVDYCKSQNITVTAYSPLGSSAAGLNGQPSLLGNAVVKRMAERLNKSPAQVLVRYNVQQGIACLPKSVNKARIEENLNVFDFQLTEQDLTDLDSLNCNYRFFKFRFAGIEQHPDFPFK
ncbi:1,5-anhydro-D-fructose reductase [Halotydeus destructor]|nr:1,5-anhydro-D-fructose reductase [Halotydeus destructor]